MKQKTDFELHSFELKSTERSWGEAKHPINPNIKNSGFSRKTGSIFGLSKPLGSDMRQARNSTDAEETFDRRHQKNKNGHNNGLLMSAR